MKFSRFVTDPNETPLHSSGLAGDGVPKPQSFTEREQLERHRRLIKSYQQSLIGSVNQPRGKLTPPPRPPVKPTRPSESRQQFNTTSQPGFKEPPARRFNPYA